MSYSDQFFKALGVVDVSAKSYNEISKLTKIPTDRLKYYNQRNIMPSGKDLSILCEEFNISPVYFQLMMGHMDMHTLELIQENASFIYEKILSPNITVTGESSFEKDFELVLQTKNGELYNGDCLKVSKNIDADSVDMIFADPPFNLDKLYPSKMNDNLKEEEYIKWTHDWLNECIRILKPGGSLFLWNLPVWNSKIANFLHGRLNFKHWIAVDMKNNMPIQGRLYPSHYSLLYFIKGEKANVFEPDRLAAQTCPKCFGDLKDYGGYKSKMNPLGINLTDVWYDIPPVRHKKYKKRNGANELSIKVLDRVIEMATKEGDLIFDPFGGSGTTYVIAEIKNRRWIGSEIDDCEIIKERFSNLSEDKEHLVEVRGKLNSLFPSTIKREREKRGLWTVESVRMKDDEKKTANEHFGLLQNEEK
ncbi:site-specific DNA-methyltransferase [Salmonella enterica]|uniref:site-specific DNA-methyltransferase (adenine-specific) n=1 Tax=Salmonella diarizonae TaxID=59204 RepID=A0A379U565_SALDZ|nr:site-specific DNA-methyltransferase [Salmonella enterica]EBP3906051.1 site-specific DNA-methyltransferase [Salmonella enterica subsp. enterica]ECG1716933.1 site-specific DNA-methyltransferase [Salmonella enterica subsp. diarizonae serovar 17:z10:e,n,x,z15]EDS4947775.1 site-specific DNA-methyltransferase [Salmonella enterica subsp. enterica serovar Redlands]EDX2472799.1 site-specific DNA-methyltransferase [Salmonella enterica subsp. diarizonae serovar 16:z10:e,n,x,z15]EAA7555039.1 site-speci